ncbi:MAG: DJ-1/PfpI/YhbO family deglycase/protease [Chitinivibrionales bacterium]|nr:DJ-1/PfpI/YhbO family deglycase/protease [Chitinivibrionales bacterium]MBD3357202.1 DJ-1/PfpI/YhbO family deglycase/protease [Chitinivibrionales bacterium]
MSRIAVLIDSMFEDPEYALPARDFTAAGHALEHLGLKKGAEVRGKRNEAAVTIDTLVGEALVDRYDALFIPGGYSPDKLRAHQEAVEFVRRFAETGKPIFVICHGAQLLISADTIRGRTITGWKSITRDIKNAGATYIDQEVVEDGNLVSSRQPSDIPAFVKACLHKLS